MASLLRSAPGDTLPRYATAFNQFISAAVLLQRNENKVIRNIAAINSTESKTIRN